MPSQYSTYFLFSRVESACLNTCRPRYSFLSLVGAHDYLGVIVPLFDTLPELLDVWFAFMFVVLLSPIIVLLTMFCEPIAVIVIPGPPFKSKPCFAAATWPAELPSNVCMVAESSAFPLGPVPPHILLEELFDGLPEKVLCASTAVERNNSPVIVSAAPIATNSFVMILVPLILTNALSCAALDVVRL